MILPSWRGRGEPDHVAGVVKLDPVAPQIALKRRRGNARLIDRRSCLGWCFRGRLGFGLKVYLIAAHVNNFVN
jgi:hypothetical protein